MADGQQTPAEVTSLLSDAAENDSLSLVLSEPVEDSIEAVVVDPDSAGGPNIVPTNQVDIELEISDKDYKNISIRIHESGTDGKAQPLHILRLEEPTDALNSIPEDDETPGVVTHETLDQGKVIQHMTDMTFPDSDRGYPIAKIEVATLEEETERFHAIAGEVRAVDHH